MSTKCDVCGSQKISASREYFCPECLASELALSFGDLTFAPQSQFSDWDVGPFKCTAMRIASLRDVELIPFLPSRRTTGGNKIRASVYVFLNYETGEIQYVGYSNTLPNRLATHKKWIASLFDGGLGNCVIVALRGAASIQAMSMMETLLIRSLNPRYNGSLDTVEALSK